MHSVCLDDGFCLCSGNRCAIASAQLERVFCGTFFGTAAKFGWSFKIARTIASRNGAAFEFRAIQIGSFTRL
ncbi:MAG: hypothetical protein DHS20C16_17160 [Phycisphaerae bacterium]|nr:MAG: hypothetical protein DHS20C16_17160 [Phycisphaerae bacterium]